MLIEPCFFCGKQFVLQPKVKTVGDYKNYFMVECPRCRLSVPYDEAKPTEEQAIELWNNRMRNLEFRLILRRHMINKNW